ncbi:hypothetical protein Q5P01_011787 [Channa striata]|uniref:Uncharacterized protein n=1 Tax=Channa striata TaxID=64152 RepID=A0AA88STQ7_CHASR|nr:hypothetical protein Q5P01_011787 [Channa striata]
MFKSTILWGHSHMQYCINWCHFNQGRGAGGWSPGSPHLLCAAAAVQAAGSSSEIYVGLNKHMSHDSELHVRVIDTSVGGGVMEPAGGGRSAQCELLGLAGKRPRGEV